MIYGFKLLLVTDHTGYNVASSWSPEMAIFSPLQTEFIWNGKKPRTASCVPRSMFRVPHAHEAPHGGTSCLCGIHAARHVTTVYAFYDRQKIMLSKHIYASNCSPVMFMVEVFGKIVEHNDGWRAQHARIAYSVDVKNSDGGIVAQQFADVDVLRHLNNNFGIQRITLQDAFALVRNNSVLTEDAH